jgi:hypothetical protein
MIKQFEDLLKEVGSKPTWSAKELLPKIQSASHQVTDQLKDGGQVLSISSAKRSKVAVIKKYDILYAPTMGVPHYFLVHKIVGQAVHGIIFTSTNKPAFCIHEVKEDRILEGSFATNTYWAVDLDVALESFVRTYESKTEADWIFRKVAAHYLTIFKK